MNGFSDDGYIIDQDYFDEYEYRTMQASINGCGWIAAYNIRHFLGHSVSFQAVMNEMDYMHSLRIPGPTTMPVMRGYLRKYVPAMTEHIGRDAAFEAAKGSEAGILRYTEEDVPHFISYIRKGEGYRFFNVNDGLEDYVSSMDMFFKTHVLPPHYVSIFTI
ncbi:MAG: hypothetical protein IJV51_00515 [Oscillospiraceae bacterium]|nr:hypothetical protein [Oscillospiraceae bacterium]